MWKEFFISEHRCIGVGPIVRDVVSPSTMKLSTPDLCCVLSCWLLLQRECFSLLERPGYLYHLTGTEVNARAPLDGPHAAL